jgi:hypothetical protein
MLTHEDRNAIDGLFQRLAEAERRGGPRDAEAEALIRQRILEQPAAPYYLAQTVVVQQEALKEAERRMQELEGGGRSLERRGPWDGPQRYDDRQPAFGAGGGFLAGAAQTALGVAGGMMLANMIGSIFSTGAANAGEFGSGDNQASDEQDAGGDFGGGDDFDVGGDF